MFISHFEIILVYLHGKAASVPFCERECVLCGTKRLKGFRMNFSLVFVLGGGTQSQEAHDFYHGFTCDSHAVLLFDH